MKHYNINRYLGQFASKNLYFLYEIFDGLLVVAPNITKLRVT